MPNVSAVTERGPSIGRLDNHEIPGWIRDATGQIWTYIGATGPVVEMNALNSNECVVSSGLIYRRSVSGLQ